MKCIHCGADARRREREATGGCPRCGRRFVFEPASDGDVTDLMFKLALVAVSDTGRLRWTDDHLYYELCRRVRRRRGPLHRLCRRVVSVRRDTFELLLARWIDAHGRPEGRLEAGSFEHADAHPPDIDQLAVDQLVICAEDTTADVLLANNFHADVRCAVLSYGGYPAHVHAALVPVLRQQPPSTLVVVHSADPAGCRLRQAVAEDPRWFAGVELPSVVDAGLRPRDAVHFRGLNQRAAGEAPGASTDLLPSERKWLGSYRLELAAVPPRALMTTLARVLRGETQAAASNHDGGGWWVGDTWGDDDEDVG